eukprot:8017333-Alexandrium_andersonii.AAC.1
MTRFCRLFFLFSLFLPRDWVGIDEGRQTETGWTLRNPHGLREQCGVTAEMNSGALRKAVRTYCSDLGVSGREQRQEGLQREGRGAGEASRATTTKDGHVRHERRVWVDFTWGRSCERGWLFHRP